MPARFIDLDRQTLMFLPYDLREWAPEGHIVHIILEAVEPIPTAHFRVNHRGRGGESGEALVFLILRDSARNKRARLRRGWVASQGAGEGAYPADR